MDDFNWCQNNSLCQGLSLASGLPVVGCTMDSHSVHSARLSTLLGGTNLSEEILAVGRHRLRDPQ